MIIASRLIVLAMPTKNIIRTILVTAGLLLIPVFGNMYVDGWNWDLFDFVFAGILIFGTSFAYEFVASKSVSVAYRAAVGVALATAFLLVWINAAVGIIGDGDLDSPNGMYFLVLAVGIIGAALARLEPQGMARALFATAFTQMLVPVIALIFWKSDFTPGVAAVFGLNAFFAMLWFVSAVLFQRAGHKSGILGLTKPTV